MTHFAESTSGLAYEESPCWNTQAKALDCEAIIINMVGETREPIHHVFKNKWGEVEHMINLKNLGSAQKSKFSTLFMGKKTFMHTTKKGYAFFYLRTSYNKCRATITWDPISIQRLQGCVWKKEFRQLIRTLTIWLHGWLGRRCTTLVWTHLQLLTWWTCNTLRIH